MIHNAADGQRVLSTFWEGPIYFLGGSYILPGGSYLLFGRVPYTSWEGPVNFRGGPIYFWGGSYLLGPNCEDGSSEGFGNESDLELELVERPARCDCN